MKGEKIMKRENRGVEFRRGVQFLELRAEGDGESRTLTGYAAIFDSETVIGDWFREVIRPGAFTKTLQESDQVALFDHNSGMPLGRKSRGTLKLEENDKGLRVEVIPPANSWGDDVYEAVKRGDVQGMSFAFETVKERWDEDATRKEGKLPLREILEARLFEVSFVTFPAYEATEAEARSVLEEREKRGGKDGVTRRHEGTKRTDGGAESSDSLRKRAAHERRHYLLRLRGESIKLLGGIRQ